MQTYLAIVHKDADSAFGVSFPDLPGCFSAADRLEDVMPNAREALALWFEDAGDVEPRDVAAIHAELTGDLAEGAFLIAVPRVHRAGLIALYMRLLDEDVQVYRPIEAEEIGTGRYRVLGPIPDGETWEFIPGEIVSLQAHRFDTGERGIVAAPDLN